MIPLPIDDLLPELDATLRSARALVLSAPPGAGKTTRVPPRVLDLLGPGGGEVLVLEPRRVAAYLSAARVAEERGGALGDEVGVQLRFESVCGPRTRLRFMTEGVLLRRIQAEPTLPGVGAVLLDEFHERHLHGDVALALLRRLQRGPRPELKLVVMSATLEVEALAAYLDAPVLRSAGRLFDVAISYLPEADDRPVEKQVRSAVHRWLADDPQGGHALVFLPGAAEIRRSADELAELAGARGLALTPLHGDLPLNEQRRAVAPEGGGDPERRRVILATNVAETSVTVPGVTAVIDSGLARVAGHSPWSGLPTLRLSRICRAAALQRAGRAGRTGPGRCLRLYTRHDFETRPEFEAPELQRLDLCETVLLLRVLGLPLAGADALEFLQPPKEPALRAAEALLRRLGAVSDRGEVTALGRRLSALPLHPRQARVLLGGADRGVGAAAATVAALLGERDLRGGASFSDRERGRRREAEHHDVSDLLHLLWLFGEARRARGDRGRLAGLGLDPGAVAAVERAQRQLFGYLPRGARNESDALTPAQEDALLQSILDGYPDRVARRRPERGDLLLAGGGTAAIAPQSVVQDEDLVVIIDAEERSAGAGPGQAPRVAQVTARVLSGVKADWLIDLPGVDRAAEGDTPILREVTEARFVTAGERVEQVRRLCYEGIVLDESRAAADPHDPAVTAALRTAAQQAGPALWRKSEDDLDEALQRLHLRVAFVAERCPDAGLSPPPPLPELIAAAIADLCVGCTRFEELRAASLRDAVSERLGVGPALSPLLSRLAPESLTLPGGRRARIEYAAGQAPWLASRLQDFFGMTTGPTIAGGRVPLVLHLLAPSQRPVQVTTDLGGFWDRHYPAIRRELMRQYPRHAWPADPRTATPPPQGRPR